jgi:hypothetical protein
LPRPSRGRARGILLGLVAASASAAFPGCSSAGAGTDPPPNIFYFPVGLAVSRGGNVRYAVNSDFDLQWNGGTIQSYDLALIRRHTLLAIHDPADPNLPFINPNDAQLEGACPNDPPLYQTTGTGQRQPLGRTCAPPVDSTQYVRDSAVIGAFATDLQLAHCDPDVVSTPGGCDTVSATRLYTPVRGDATVTWADVTPDDPNVAPPDEATPADYAPYALDCGTRQGNTCDTGHKAGNNPYEPGNTRSLTLPGEPFGMAQSEDGTVIVLTHQTSTNASLLTTGLAPATPRQTPALQFVLDTVAIGGNGVTVIPHDPDAFPGCAAASGPQACSPRPAFLETSRNVAELDLLRYYDDESGGTVSSSHRPFMTKEATYSLTTSPAGSDSRGIAIDKSPRIACKLRATTDADRADCARRPARVFFANRAPAQLLVGEIGETSNVGDGTYNADALLIYQSVPLSFGPSKVYVAPIVDANGDYALRIFIVCFDAAKIFIYDPDAGQVENIISTGPGPFAMTFDPFSLEDVAAGKHVETDPRQTGPDGPLLRYRFAYVASFTQSYVQVLDLDGSRADKSTFENVVFTLGAPTSPKGTR